jgi:zinc transporter ZupT
MKNGEKIGLAAVIIAFIGLIGGLIAFLYNANFSNNLQFYVKLNYVFIALLAVAVGILYFISFTKESKGGKK